MAPMYRLVNGSRSYDWGSASQIPHFFGDVPDGSPVAEIWMGTHALSPSRIDHGEVGEDGCRGGV